MIISKGFEVIWLQRYKKRWQSTFYELYNHLLHYYVLCLCYKTRKTALKYNHACNNVPSQLERIWNWSFIGQYLNQARNHWWKIKLQQRLFLDVLALTTFISHLYIKECYLKNNKTLQHFESAKTLSNCSASKSSLRISVFKFISLKFKSLKSLYLICIVNTTDCISSVQPQTFFFVILFDRSLLVVCLSIRSLLIVFLSIWSLLLMCLSICNQILP